MFARHPLSRIVDLAPAGCRSEPARSELARNRKSERICASSLASLLAAPTREHARGQAHVSYTQSWLHTSGRACSPLVAELARHLLPESLPLVAELARHLLPESLRSRQSLLAAVALSVVERARSACAALLHIFLFACEDRGEVEHNREHLSGMGEDLCTYVSRWAGGKNPIYLKELDMWTKSLPLFREISSKQLGMLGRAPLGLAPEYITACCKALLAAPKHYIKKDEASIFDQSDIDDMSGKKADRVKEAVEVMRNCRTWITGMGLSLEEPAIHKFIGFLDTNLVMCVHQKAAKERVSFNDVKACGCDFVKMIVSAFADKVDTQKLPYEIIEAEPSKRACTPSGSSGSLMEYKDGKFDPAQLTKMGFTVGALVKRKGGKDKDMEKDESYKIKAIQSDSVELEKFEIKKEGDKKGGKNDKKKDKSKDAKEETITVTELVDSYVLMEKEIKPTTYSGEMVPNAASLKTVVQDVARARVVLALRKAFSDSCDAFSAYKYQTKPDRKLFVLDNASKGTLVLVPFSTVVGIANGKKGVPMGAVTICTLEDGVTTIFVSKKDSPPSTPQGSKTRGETFMTPFWYVRVSDKKGDCNLDVAEKIVHVLGEGVCIPTFQNSRAVKAEEELVIHSDAYKTVLPLVDFQKGVKRKAPEK